VLAPTSGLARVTIRAPRRRLDLSLPHQVPLAELLPEVLRRAGETGGGHEGGGPDAVGWILRRGDGASLTGDVALAPQGVRDGDVLYLVPHNLTWPEPGYDDVVEEIAAGARSHGRIWDAAATRVFALVAAGLLLLAGLGLLVGTGSAIAAGLAAGAVAVVLLLVGALLSRAGSDALAGTAAAGFALPYTAVAGALLAAGNAGAEGGIGAAGLLVGACALLLGSVVGAVAVGDGLRIFVAGGTVGLFGAVGALIGLGLSAAGAAAIVVVVLIAGIGLAPLLAVRLGKLPLPVVTAVPELLAAERRPDRATMLAAVVRADEILAGSLFGIAVATAGCVALLARDGGTAGVVLGGVAAGALLLRSRLFPSLAARLPLLVSGLVGLTVVAWIGLTGLGGPARLVGAAVAVVMVLVLLGTTATAHRRRPGGSPYLGRMADILDVATVVALAPVACAVLNLYGWVRGLAG
jgi:type VII secretion integral membrane protein EccD